MELIDKTGQPRSNEDLLEAIKVIRKRMITMTTDPELFVMFPTILNALEELLILRK